METTYIGQALIQRHEKEHLSCTEFGGGDMDTLNFMNATNIGNADVIDDRRVRDILRSVPGSYDDFVNSTAECMSQDGKLKSMILNLIRIRPEVDSSGVLRALCDFYGFNKPLELVDDDNDDDEMFPGANIDSLRKAAY